MSREKELVKALAAMVEFVRKYKSDKPNYLAVQRYVHWSEEEARAYENAVKLLAEAQANCDECVDY